MSLEHGNIISLLHTYFRLIRNEIYDEIPAYDPPSYESLQRSSEHNYEMLGKQQMGSNYMDVIA